MKRRQVILERVGDERTAIVGALTLECPFCGKVLGPLAGGGV